MGPAPVAAVYFGEGHIGYDTEFVIGEVNADERSWTRRADGKGWELTNLDQDKIGPFLLTRWPGATDGASLPENMSKPKDTLNVMPIYKPKEGTLAERATLFNYTPGEPAPMQARGTRGALVGSPLEVVVTHTSGSASFILECWSAAYTGRAGKLIKKATADGASATLTVTPEEYRDYLADTSCAFEFRCFATHEQNGEEKHCAQVVQTVLAVPELAVRGATAGVGKGPTEYTVAFTNPLPYDLGAADLSTSATRGVTVEVSAGNGQLVEAGATAELKLSVSRSDALAGKRAVITLELDTAVLTDISGEIEIEFA